MDRYLHPLENYVYIYNNPYPCPSWIMVVKRGIRCKEVKRFPCLLNVWYTVICVTICFLVAHPIDTCVFFTHIFRVDSLCLGQLYTVYPNKYAHGFCFAVLCCGYTLTDFPISIRLTSLALGQSNDCPSASKANLMNMDKYFMWIHYERLRNHNKAKHNKIACIFFGIYCTWRG